MIFTIDKKNYRLKIAWNTVTLNDATSIAKLNLPEGFITGDFKQSPRQMIEVLAILSNCPIEVLSQTDEISIISLYEIVHYMVNQLYTFNLDDYNPIGVQEIRFKGKRFLMPKTILIDDKPIFCYDEPCKKIIESNNLIQLISEMKHEGIDKMRYICAMYLNEKGKRGYDAEVIEKRANLFRELPMTIVWDVFFFIYSSLSSYMIATVIPSLKEERSKAKRIRYTMHGFLLLLKRKSLVWCARWKK